MAAGIDASARVSSCPVRARMCLDKVAGLIPLNSAFIPRITQPDLRRAHLHQQVRLLLT
jgi:hypothetical protein